jgi:hypothetical protein
VRSQGGVGEDGKVGGDVGEERAAVLALMEASGEEGRRAGKGRLRCGMLRGGGALL